MQSQIQVARVEDPNSRANISNKVGTLMLGQFQRKALKKYVGEPDVGDELFSDSYFLFYVIVNLRNEMDFQVPTSLGKFEKQLTEAIKEKTVSRKTSWLQRCH